ncbi:hypothetical protein B0H16DRAFT_1879177 [Mycena metata]|uniref:F-box domain-containing protein n=1 Tax=Mycena metata TaxID=1033252 RepID=A0AAD7K5C8_9AGAR|nr:hypothetical protein B0H16DRAFT_1879177 [Mycena metata]
MDASESGAFGLRYIHVQIHGLQIDLRLVDLGAEIAALQRQLEQLTEERQSLIRLRAQNNAVFSPLRRIPPEVLAEIFTWTLPLARNSSLRRRFFSHDSPWLLTHISRLWRAVAISTPSLWSLLTISYQRGMDPAGLYPLPMLETQISRAQKLKIHFYGEETTDPEPQLEVFRYLALHSSRWEELVVLLTSSLLPVLNAIHLPLLRRLFIEWSGEISQADVDSLHCFEQAPTLVDVTTINEFRWVSLRLPVHQLTHYRVDGAGEFPGSVLVLGANLVEVHIHVTDNSEPWLADVDERIHLPCLRRLYVYDTEILDFLVAPTLEEISLWSDMEQEIQSRVRPFVERSACTLRRLCLVGYVDAVTITNILNDTTSVVELAIDFEYTHDVWT